MEFFRDSDLGKNSYFLSNSGCFLHRFADSGFKNKWTGYWHKEHKFLEYFAFLTGGEWLSEHNCRSLRYDGETATHIFRVRGKQAVQTACLSGPSLVIAIKTGSRKDIHLELAANIRRRGENRTDRPYSVSSSQGSVSISNELGTLRISSPKLRFQPGPVVREHSPGGEPQNCIVPGGIALPGPEVAVVMTPSLRGSKGKASVKPQELDRFSRFSGLLKSDNAELESGFYWSAVATELCRKQSSSLTSFCAGLPWFQQVWARDVLWVVPSLLRLGYFSEVRDTLRGFALRSEGGRIPNLISGTEGIVMNGLDPSMLWLISMRDYFLATGDMRFLMAMSKRISSTSRYLMSCDLDNDGYIEHDSRFPETWMDTLKRDSKAIEMQALYCSSMESSGYLLGLLKNRLASEAGDRAARLRKGLERDFFTGRLFADRLFGRQKVDVRTSNSLVPLILGFSGHASQVLREIESTDFTSGRGVRTRARGEQDYSPEGYHTGSVWSLTTAWASAAEFLSKRTLKGWLYLKAMLADMERDALGCIGECWNPENGLLTGSPLQLWGSGFVPRIIDEFMLGIRVDCSLGIVEVSPQVPPLTSSVERTIMTGRGPVRLSFRDDSGSVMTSVDGKGFRLVQP